MKTSWLVTIQPAESSRATASRISGVTSIGDSMCVWITNCWIPTSAARVRKRARISVSAGVIRWGR